ncbi:hypothetical protein GGH99_005136, partial [Coemansia sp. RSA 1285]
HARMRSDEDDLILLDTQNPFSEKKQPFLTLSLELPPKPLFNDDEEEGDDNMDNAGRKSSIPQVPFGSLIQRYNGSVFVECQGE